jgi:FdhD protein
LERGISRVRRYIGTECGAPDVLRELRTADGIPSITTKARVGLNELIEAAELLFEFQVVRKKTGAMHGAFLHSFAGNRYALAEDLGRHNAVDKVIGLTVQQKINPKDYYMITSGRLTADMVSECAWTSIPLPVSFSVSTDAGIKFVQKANVTVIGALKGKRMRVYNHGACDIG